MLEIPNRKRTFFSKNKMNRIILIGNGFDLAHGLKTRYADFIDWYWEEWGERLRSGKNILEEDHFCSFLLNNSVPAAGWYLVWLYCVKMNPARPWTNKELVDIAKGHQELCTYKNKSDFFEKICNHLQTKKWVDIEDAYYKFLKRINNPKRLNDDLEFIKEKLIEYLSTLEEAAFNSLIRKQILEPISQKDIAIGSKDKWKEVMKDRLNYDKSKWEYLIEGYILNRENPHYSYHSVEYFKKIYGLDIINGEVDESICPTFRLPDNIMLLNFNYTNTSDLYLPKADKFTINHIHGSLSKPESVIFGYGDERDDEYEVLMKKNDNEYLRHIKSFRYLEASNYRNLLSFIESAPYQVCIMGHSCGLSDRTLLATLFEHPNCVSIKPYYHKKDDGTDNYRELVQNIARNFTDPRLMRDRVVGKERCEALGKVKEG